MKRRNLFGYVFIAPFFIVYAIFGIYPVLLSFYLSFTNYRGVGSPYNADIINFANYTRLLQDSYFLDAFFNTWKVWGINIILQLSIALFLAILFADQRLKLKGVSFFRALFYLPNLITISSIALLFSYILDWQHGPLNMILLQVGTLSKPINWLGQPVTAQLSVSLILTWLWFGHTFIIMFAGVQGISKDYFDAAMVDGANRRKMFTHVTIPLLKPILIYITITSLIGGLQLFELPLLITAGNGSPQGSLMTMVYYLYNKAFQYYDVGYAAAVAYGLFIIILAFALIIYRSIFRSQKEGA